MTYFWHLDCNFFLIFKKFWGGWAQAHLPLPLLQAFVAKIPLLSSYCLIKVPILDPFLESPDNFSGPQSCFESVRLSLKIHILLVFKAKQ